MRRNIFGTFYKRLYIYQDEQWVDNFREVDILADCASMLLWTFSTCLNCADTGEEMNPMTYDEAFEFLDRTARGIAQMFGSSCETLVHDMSVPEHPILSIYNGHVSGRSVGSTMDILGVGQLLDEQAQEEDFVNLYATTPAGQQIKSSTFHMITDEYNLALGINFDYSSLVFANRILVDLMSAGADLKSAIWRGGDNRLSEMFDECLAVVGKPVNALNKADRLKIIAMLNGRKAFSFRKSVPFVSQRLGVSRYTVYKYLAEIAEQEELHADEEEH